MAQPPSSSELRRTLKASLSALANDINDDSVLQPAVKQRHMDDLKQIAVSIGAQIDVDSTSRLNVLHSTSLLLNRISSSFSRTSLTTARSNLEALQASYLEASEQRRRAVAQSQAELAAGRVQDAELRHLETIPDMSFGRPSVDSAATRSSSGNSNTSSLHFNSGNRGSYDSLAPQPAPSFGRHPNPSTKSVNKDSANFTRVHDDGSAYPRPRTRSLRNLFQGSTTSLAPSASYPYSQQPQYGLQGNHASAASLVPPVPQMPPGSMYPGATTSPSSRGPNYYPVNPSTTSLMPAPGQPYASTQSLQGQYYATPSQGFNPARVNHESMQNMPGMAPQPFYGQPGQVLDPRDPNFHDPARQYHLMNEYNQSTPKKERRPKH